MSSIASIESVDGERSIDLPIGNVPLILTFFGNAWQSNDWETSRTAMPAPCRVIQRRMELLGFTKTNAIADFVRLHDAWLYVLEKNDDTARAAAQLRNLGPARAWEAIQRRSKEADQIARGLVEHLMTAEDNEEFPQTSTIIRLALSTFAEEENVLANISWHALFDLIPGDVEWHEDEFPKPASLALLRDRSAWRNTKPILLLEGTYDAKVIQTAFQLRTPDLADYISIADFTQGTDGGAGGLRKTLRTLGQLEIPNTILGLFDNDAAGHEAIELLARDALPSNIGYNTYPDLELARLYPTLGPTGVASLDINGRGVSVEHFLGLDCLAGIDGPTPVEWTGYNRKVNRYQGSLLSKGDIQKRFDRKIERARAGAIAREDDWSSIDLLLEFVVDEIVRVSDAR